MVNQPKPADIFTVAGIVATLKGYAMIPYMSVSVYGLVQLTIAVISIHFELVGFHYGLSFCLSYLFNIGVDIGTLARLLTVEIPYRKTRKVYHISPAISTFLIN